MHIYPNPSYGALFIELDNDHSENWIWIRDGQGRLIQKIEVKTQDKISVNTKAWRSGLYWISRIKEGKIVEAEKFLLIR